MDEYKKKIEQDLLELKKQIYDENLCNISISKSQNIPFIVKLNSDKTMGVIEKYGDMFIGFKNTNNFSIDVTFRSNSFVEKITVPRGEIGYIFNGYPVHMNFINSDIQYEIKKTYPNDFFYSVFFKTEPINVQLVYGNVTTEVKNILADNFVYINFVHNSLDMLFMFYKQNIQNWLDVVAREEPELLNEEFRITYLNNKYKDNEIVTQFKEKNPNWIRLNVNYKLNTFLDIGVPSKVTKVNI